MNENRIGFLCCVALFFIGFLLNGQMGLYFNFSGLLIVLGGTAGAALLSYRMERLKIVWKVLRSSYCCQHKRPEELVEILVDLSVKSKFQGLLSLQKDEKQSTMLFMRQGLGLLVDGYSGKAIREILDTEMYFFKMRRDDCERVVRSIAALLPPFGLVGSVVGLIAMLGGVDDPSKILQSVPIALTSTLYGVVFANFFFLPFAGNLREYTSHELLNKKIILEGLLAIESDMDPRSLEKKLKSFLTPSARQGRLVSLQRIQERFHIKPIQESV